MRLHAAHLRFPLPTSTAVSSLLFDPSSQSLALMLSDSSALLYPNFAPSFYSSPAPSVVPPTSTSASFVRLLPSGHVLFLSAAPFSSGSAVQLRAWARKPSADCKGASFDRARISFRSVVGGSSVVLDCSHGLGVRLVGSVNVFVLHLLASGSVWVFAVKPLVDGKEVSFRLVKCAVIELTLPIYSIGLSAGFLVLGEMDGVRVYPLRSLIKGRAAKVGALGQQSSNLMVGDRRKNKYPNGVVIPQGHAIANLEEELGSCCNYRDIGKDGTCEEKNSECYAPCKLKTLKLRQNSKDNFSLFVVIKPNEIESSGSYGGLQTSLKAVSIHFLSQKKILILDSAGNLHVLTLSRPTTLPEITHVASVTSKEVDMYHLAQAMEVQLLAVLPDSSSKLRVVWISDGGYSMHLISVADIESHIDEIVKDTNRQKAFSISALEAIFTSNKIQDIVPLSATSVLVLCEGNIYTYAVA